MSQSLTLLTDPLKALALRLLNFHRFDRELARYSASFGCRDVGMTLKARRGTYRGGLGVNRVLLVTRNLI